VVFAGFGATRSATSGFAATGEAVTSSGEPHGGERGTIRSPVLVVRWSFGVFAALGVSVVFAGFSATRSATSGFAATGEAVTSSGEPHGGERGTTRSPVLVVRWSFGDFAAATSGSLHRTVGTRGRPGVGSRSDFGLPVLGATGSVAGAAMGRRMGCSGRCQESVWSFRRPATRTGSLRLSAGCEAPCVRSGRGDGPGCEAPCARSGRGDGPGCEERVAGVFEEAVFSDVFGCVPLASRG
jgi:hypothetical protein